MTDPFADDDEASVEATVPPFAPFSAEDAVEGEVVRRRGIYLLPNLLTTGALFAGFYAILSAMNGKFSTAAVAIFVAMVFDGLDGRVARLTNTQSAFGVQYDSLSDMVSFGVAPAVVSYAWMLKELGKLGWAAAFIYASCAALRLARFNVQVGSADKRFFVGLASPAAAGVVAGIVWSGQDLDPSGGIALTVCLMTAAAGLLMVTNFRYHSMKGVDFRGRVPFIRIVAAVIGAALVVIDPPRVLLAIFFAYALSGPSLWLWRRYRRGLAARGESA